MSEPRRTESGVLSIGGAPTLRELERFCEEARALGIEGDVQVSMPTLTSPQLRLTYAVVPASLVRA